MGQGGGRAVQGSWLSKPGVKEWDQLQPTWYASWNQSVTWGGWSGTPADVWPARYFKYEKRELSENGKMSMTYRSISASDVCLHFKAITVDYWRRGEWLQRQKMNTLLGSQLYFTFSTFQNVEHISFLIIASLWKSDSKFDWHFYRLVLITNASLQHNNTKLLNL